MIDQRFSPLSGLEMKGDEFSDGSEQEVIGRPIHHLLKLHRVDLVKLKAFTIVLETFIQASTNQIEQTLNKRYCGHLYSPL